MDLTLPTLAALLTTPLYVNICDPAPCRTVEVRAEGNRVIIVGAATSEQVLSAVLRHVLHQGSVEAARLKAISDALPDRFKAP